MKHPASTRTLPASGSGCGLRPDPAALTEQVGFDFSGAKALLEPQSESADEQKTPPKAPDPAYTER